MYGDNKNIWLHRGGRQDLRRQLVQGYFIQNQRKISKFLKLSKSQSDFWRKWPCEHRQSSHQRIQEMSDEKQSQTNYHWH